MTIYDLALTADCIDDARLTDMVARYVVGGLCAIIVLVAVIVAIVEVAERGNE